MTWRIVNFYASIRGTVICICMYEVSSLNNSNALVLMILKIICNTTNERNQR